jgi:integrase
MTSRQATATTPAHAADTSASTRHAEGASPVSAGTPPPQPGRPTAPGRTGRPTRRRRVNQGGSINRLSSGRWRVRYFGDDGKRRSRTFATQREAADYLAEVRTDRVRGTWRAPDAGAIPLADFAGRWLASRHDLRPSTRALYADLLRRWIAADLILTPTPGSGTRRLELNLGRRHLSTITLADVREWHSAVLQTAATGARTRTNASAQRHRESSANVRSWARATGLEVAETGRLPRAVIEAHRAAGSPVADTTARRLERLERDEPAGATQARQAYALLREVMTAALAEGHVTANPCQLPRAGTARTARRQVTATPAEVELLAAAMPAHLAAAVTLGAYSGLRGGELFALARRHVDLVAGTVTVERTVVELRGAPITFGPPKTTAGYRTVALPPSVLEVLRRHLAEHVGRSGNALLFTNSRGDVIARSRRTEAFRRACTTTGLDHLTWHSLRHTGATLYAKAGATLKDLQARLGHSTVAAAMVYQHTSADRDRELANALDHHRVGASAIGIHAAADAARSGVVTPIHRPA